MIQAQPQWQWRHLGALAIGNVALALGPFWVRLADSGPVSAGFWRLTLALPFLWLLAAREGQPLRNQPRGLIIAVGFAGLAFAFDLAAWHLGIVRTHLGNATLFGNSGSLIVMAWGLVAGRRWPRINEWAALAAALTGCAILFGRSLEISAVTLSGDLLCLLAGFFYAFYIIALQGARVSLGNGTLLLGASLTGAPVLFAIAWFAGEPIWPHVWWPLLVLALSSQVIGQGALVYALRHFTPLVIGLVLLTQPVVGIAVGWWRFGEVLTPWDGIGMALVAGALVIVRAGERPASARVLAEEG
jgi:drug/metabolite transporter (DMT)-like permease